jgi:hypothetical protein
MSLEEKRRIIWDFEYAIKQLNPEWTIDSDDVKDAIFQLSKLVGNFPSLEYCEDYQRVKDVLNSLKNPLSRMLGKSCLYDLAEYGAKLIEKAKALLDVEEKSVKGLKEEKRSYKKSRHIIRCPNCNAEMPGNAKFCGFCGTNLQKGLDKKEK